MLMSVMMSANMFEDIYSYNTHRVILRSSYITFTCLILAINLNSTGWYTSFTRHCSVCKHGVQRQRQHFDEAIAQ